MQMSQSSARQSALGQAWRARLSKLAHTGDQTQASVYLPQTTIDILSREKARARARSFSTFGGENR